MVPDRAENFAFLGQLVEIPDGVVFTVEYSMCAATLAVYQHFQVDKEIPPFIAARPTRRSPGRL